MTNLQKWGLAALGVSLATLAVVAGPAIVAAAPLAPGPQSGAVPALVSADFTVTYSYDQNGNRTSEVGRPLPQESGADKCGNGSPGLIPLFLNGQVVSMYPGTCQ